jgi:hypothetical protein
LCPDSPIVKGKKKNANAMLSFEDILKMIEKLRHYTSTSHDAS